MNIDFIRNIHSTAGAVDADDTDTKMAFCLYNNTMFPNKQIGCSTLDLSCSSGTYIQITDIYCGMTSILKDECDHNTPSNCRTKQKCCAQDKKDIPVAVLVTEKDEVRRTCDYKVSCSQDITVVRKINDTYPRHYCMVTYTCKQGKIKYSSFTDTVNDQKNICLKGLNLHLLGYYLTVYDMP